MDKFSLRLKVYTRKNTHSALEEENMFCVSGFADLSVFCKGHCSQVLSWSGNSWLSRHDTKFVFLLQLNLIRKLLGKVMHFLDEKVELKLVSALFMDSLIAGRKLVASSASCSSMLIWHLSSQVSTEPVLCSVLFQYSYN